MFNRRFKVKTEKRFSCITSKVEELLSESGYVSGLVNVFVGHTTCGVKILENEVLSLVDISDHLESVAPSDGFFEHDRIELRDVPPDERVNGVSHVHMIYFSSSISIPFIDGRLCLGKWQDVFLVELDYQTPFRERDVFVSVLDGD